MADKFINAKHGGYQFRETVPHLCLSYEKISINAQLYEMYARR